MKVVVGLKQLPRINEIGHNENGDHVIEFELDDLRDMLERNWWLIYRPNENGGAAKVTHTGTGLQQLLWTSRKVR